MPVMIEDMDVEEVAETPEPAIPSAPPASFSQADRRRLMQEIALRSERALRWEVD